MVAWHWAYMGMSVGWEPGAGLRGGPSGSEQGGFHRWSVVGVATVLVRGAKTDPHGWDVVVEAEQGLERVAGGVVVVP